MKKLSVSGLKRVEENQVLAKAGFEVGTNVFRVNLDEIRERVEELPWVRHASSSAFCRIKIIIKVVEREPIGLAGSAARSTNSTPMRRFSNPIP